MSEQLIAALPNIVSQVEAGLNANQESNLRAEATRNIECMYKAFRTFNAKDSTELKELLDY